MMQHVDLCSGIGGFAQRIGETIKQLELAA